MYLDFKRYYLLSARIVSTMVLQAGTLSVIIKQSILIFNLYERSVNKSSKILIFGIRFDFISTERYVKYEVNIELS